MATGMTLEYKQVLQEDRLLFFVETDDDGQTDTDSSMTFTCTPESESDFFGFTCSGKSG